MFEQLQRDLDARSWYPRVEPIDPTTFRVLVPNHRFEHDAIAIVVRRDPTGSGWLVSDDAHTRFIVDEDFERVAAVATKAGSPLVATGEELCARVSDEADLAQAVLSAAAELAALPSIWHALQVAKEGDRVRKQAATAIDVMAREARARILDSAPRLEPLISLRRRLAHASFHATAPLVINRAQGPTRPPRVVTSFIDLSQTPQAVQLGLASNALLFDVVRQLPQVEQVYLIARGDEERIDELGSIFDASNQVTVLATTAQGPLLEAAIELEKELAAA